MNKKIKLVTWITAIAISLTLVGKAQANDRGNRYYNDRNAQVIVAHPRDVIYAGRGHGREIMIVAPNRRHYSRVSYRKKMRKMRRMRRLFNYQRFDRPVVIITRDIFR